MTRGRIFNLQRFSTQDGPGIRTTVFFKGCPLACRWCHNPEGMRSAPELLTHPARCIGCGACVAVCPRGAAFPAGDGRGLEPGVKECEACGACVEACPTGAREIAGREMGVPELIEAVSRDRVFYEESGGGVTFSGGEPLQQAAFALAGLAACRDEGLHAAIDTCGRVDPGVLEAAADLTDLFLFDLKCVDSDRHLEATGSRSEPILDNLLRLARGRVPIWLRVPLVPGFNDDSAELERMAEFASRLPAVERVQVLPYHRLGRDRRERFGLPLLDADPDPPGLETVEAAKASFERAGLQTRIGG